MLNVWYIYLHFTIKNGPGKYAIPPLRGPGNGVVFLLVVGARGRYFSRLPLKVDHFLFFPTSNRLATCCRFVCGMGDVIETKKYGITL